MQKSLVGKVDIGTRVILTKDKFNGMKATLKYIGPLEGAGVQWIGVELDEDKGNHSGEYKGKQYFQSKPSHGAFIKAANLTLLDGTPLQELHSAPPEPKTTKTESSSTKPTETKKPEPTVKKDTKPQPKDPKQPTKKGPTTGPAKTATTTAGRGTVTAPKKDDKQKLANQIQSALSSQITTLKQQLAQTQQQLRSLKQTPLQSQLQSLREKLTHLQDTNRQLSLAKQKVQHQVSTDREQKVKDLIQQMNFYKTQKEKSEKDKKRMETRLKQLEESLEETVGNEELVEKLSGKVEVLEGKNEGLRMELEKAKTDLKNREVKAAGGQTEEELLQQLSMLNQTIVLLESELEEEKNKRETIEKETKGSVEKVAEFNKMEKKMKKYEGDIAELKQALEEHSDAVAFAQQLSIKKIKIEEQLHQAKAKINELLADKDIMQQVQQSQDQITRELQHIINEKEIEIDGLIQRIKDKDSEITDHLKQNARQKQKLMALLKQNEAGAASRRIQRDQAALKQSQIANAPSSNYNNLQYLQVLKHSQIVNEKYLRIQNEFSQIKNKVGVYVLNILEALPQDFNQKFYPEGIDFLVAIKTARDKLYYLFETASSQLRERNQLYTEENEELANWMIILMSKIREVFPCLYRLELLLGVCESEEELASIVTRRAIKDQAVFLESFAADLLHKFVENSVSVAVTFEQFDQSIKTLEEESNMITGHLSTQNQTKVKLASDTMRAITRALEMILNFKILADLKQDAQVDITLEKYIKKVSQYLHEICLNSHIRYRPKMIDYLAAINFIQQLFKQFQQLNLILHLQNLNVSTQQPKQQQQQSLQFHEQIMTLKNYLLTAQSDIKQLMSDLQQIHFTDELKRLQTKLPGGMWRKRIEGVKEELLRVKQLTDQKNDLEVELVEAKKKVLIQEKEIKDKNVVKEVLEKRIGELQLRVEQIAGLEAEIKRLNDKLKNAEEGSKAMEDEIDNLIKKKSHAEDQFKKLKEKVEIQTIQGQQKTAARASVTSTLSLNSIPVKNILKQNSALRNAHLKDQVTKLRYSQLLQINTPIPTDPYKNLRKETLSSLADCKIYQPGEPVDTGRTDQLLIDIQRIAEAVKAKQQTRLVEVGTVTVLPGVNANPTKIQRVLYARMRGLLPDVVQAT